MDSDGPNLGPNGLQRLPFPGNPVVVSLSIWMKSADLNLHCFQKTV